MNTLASPPGGAGGGAQQPGIYKGQNKIRLHKCPLLL